MIPKNQQNRQEVGASAAIALYKTLHRKRSYTKLYWDVANSIGIYEAILIEVVERWCEKNEDSNKRNYYHDGEWWTAASYKQWGEMYPALGSARKIQRNFLKLTKENYIISCQAALGKGDPTKYYRVNAEAIGTLLLKGILDEVMVPNLDEAMVPNLDGHGAKFGSTMVPNLDDLYIEDQINRSDQRSDQSPLTPQGEQCEKAIEVEVEILKEEESDSGIQVTSLATQKNLDQEESISKRSDDHRVCDNSRKRVCDNSSELQSFFDAYLAEKPSNFVKHQRLSKKHKKAINRLIADYGNRSVDVFVAALTWCREQKDDWWRKTTRFSLDNLCSNGKLEEYADKHFDSMETDPSYRSRVEGKAPSMDKGRVSPAVRQRQKEEQDEFMAMLLSVPTSKL